MSDATIKATQNGPYFVTGPITIVDHDGATVKLPGGAGAALCRCGASANKPFCDGSHMGNGFDGTLNAKNRA